MEMENPTEGNSSSGELMDSDEEPMDFDTNENNVEAEAEPSNFVNGDMSEDTKNGCSSPMDTAVPSPGKTTDGELSSDGALSLNSSPNAADSTFNANNEPISSTQFSDDDDNLDLNSPLGSPAISYEKPQLESTNKAESSETTETNLTKNLGGSSPLNSGKSQEIAQISTVTPEPSVEDTGEIMSEEGEGSDDDDGSLNLNESEPSSSKKDTNVNTETTNKSNSISVHDRLDFSLRASHDDHGELDYEEEVDDGLDTSKKEEESHAEEKEEKEEGEESEKEDGEHISDDDTDGELVDDDDCEEGEIKDTPQIVPDMEEGEEISDLDDSNMEPYGDQPLCRFFIRGSCTWGMNCRFFHPGVHNGGYNEGQKDWDATEMGEPEADVAPPPIRPVSPPVETAWERGLRQAKELRKKSQKRKEAEPDFEEKRKNLSLNASDIVVVEEDTKESDDRDNNKENEREKIQFDPYYDNIASPPTPFEDEEFSYNTKPVAGWHGGGNYENFEVRWTRDPPKHNAEPYPDFRIPERERSVRGKETAKYTAKYRHNQSPAYGHERYEKRKEEPRGPLKRYEKFEAYGDLPEKPRRQQEPMEVNRTRGEQWIDPWARAKSPVRRKNSSSRSRSRGRRRSRSDSRSSSYSSGSFSSRSRSSSYSSRSSYSRSSSYSSRSSSRSRSPPRRRKGLPLVDPQKRPLIPPKSSELPPRSFVTKAGPMVPSLSVKSSLLPGKDSVSGGVDRRAMGSRSERRVSLDAATREPTVRIPEGPPKPPAAQKASRSVSKSVPKTAAIKPVTTKPAVSKPAATKPAMPKPVPAKPAATKQAVAKPQTTKPVTGKVAVTKPTVSTEEPKTADSAPKPAAKTVPEPAKATVDTRPGRSLRLKTTSISSGSSSSKSRSKSFSSSGSSRSRSRSRSRSSSGSSSSSSSSSDSDDLYGNMDSPTQSKTSRSPQSTSKVRKRSYRGHSSKYNNRETWKGDTNVRGSDRSRQDMYGRKHTDKAPPPPQVMSQAKDPLKLQGQKSSIKLTLKSTKASDSSVAKKRPIESSVEVPPAKKAAISPVKEPKEPVRMTLPKADKLIKPVKETPKSRTQAPPSPVKSPVKPTPVPVKPPPAEPAPKKKSASSRREELLKQLKAVEDAIARKRTK